MRSRRPVAPPPGRRDRRGQPIGRLVLGAAVLAATTTASVAASSRSATAAAPRFDTPAYCHGVATVQGVLSRNALEYCLQTERSAYATVLDRWNGLSEATRSHCTYVASAAGHGSAGQGSYGTLVTCLEAAKDAGGDD